MQARTRAEDQDTSAAMAGATGPGGGIASSQQVLDTARAEGAVESPSTTATGEGERSAILSSLRRGALLVAGVGFVGLAVAGVFLPLLPRRAPSSLLTPAGILRFTTILKI